MSDCGCDSGGDNDIGGCDIGNSSYDNNNACSDSPPSYNDAIADAKTCDKELAHVIDDPIHYPGAYGISTIAQNNTSTDDAYYRSLYSTNTEHTGIGYYGDQRNLVTEEHQDDFWRCIRILVFVVISVFGIFWIINAINDRIIFAKVMSETADTECTKSF